MAHLRSARNSTRRPGACHRSFRESPVLRLRSAFRPLGTGCNPSRDDRVRGGLWRVPAGWGRAARAALPCHRIGQPRDCCPPASSRSGLAKAHRFGGPARAHRETRSASGSNGSHSAKPPPARPRCELCKQRLARLGSSGGLELRRHHATRAAPGGPEVERPATPRSPRRSGTTCRRARPGARPAGETCSDHTWAHRPAEPMERDWPTSRRDTEFEEIPSRGSPKAISANITTRRRLCCQGPMTRVIQRSTRVVLEDPLALRASGCEPVERGRAG